MNKKILATSLAATIALTTLGCETTNPFTGEKQVSKTTQGTAIGAVGGLIIGAVTGSTRKALLLGAGIGALSGGLIGNYMDRQEAKLRAQLQGTGVSVTRYDNSLILNMPGNITFATDSSNVSSNFYPVLDSVALVLNEFKQTYIDIAGHTDSTGSLEYNMQLSKQRADSVSSYLASRDVSPERLLTHGQGPNDPIATNSTAEGRSMNRRVVLVLTPIS